MSETTETTGETVRGGIEVGPFVRLFPTGDNIRNEIPLPVKERQGGASDGGYIVNVMDMATMIEMLTDRCNKNLAANTDVWPHTASSEILGESYDKHIGLIDLYLGTLDVDFLDPTWEPTAGEGNWYYWEYGYRDFMWRRRSPHLQGTTYGGGRIRFADDIRRVYYDIKNMTRRDMDFSVKYKRGSSESWYNNPTVSWTGKDAPTRSDPESAKVEVDLEDIPQAVRDYRNFSATPEFVMVDICCRRYNQYSQVDDTYMYHLPVEINEGGSVSLDGWKSTDILSKMRQRWGQGAEGRSYEGFAHVVKVYYRINYPLDGMLIPWHWEPEEDRENETS